MFAGRSAFRASLPLTPTRTWSHYHQRRVSSLVFNSDGTLLASGDCDGVVYIFSLATDNAVACLYLDASVSVTALLWSGSKLLYVGASDGSLTCWALDQTAVDPLKLVDAIPTYLPFPPRVLSLFTDENSTYLIAGSRGTTEIWRRHKQKKDGYGKSNWAGLGHFTSNDLDDKVLGCWILSSNIAVVAFQLQGVRIWHFARDVQNTLTHWPIGTKIHSAHLISFPSRKVNEDTGLTAELIVFTEEAVLHFGLSLLPVPHLQPLQEFELLPDMVTLACSTVWGAAPVLLTPCAAGLAAIDLTYHQFRMVSGSLESRTTQVIHPDDGTRHWRIASFSGKFCRHVASVYKGTDGWVIWLWSATDVSSDRVILPRERSTRGTPVIRIHEQLPNLLASRTEKAPPRLFRGMWLWFVPVTLILGYLTLYDSTA